MDTTYPTTFEGISSWAKQQRIAPSEARMRFAQYAVLRSIAGSRALSRILVFKGGNALDFVWQPNRSTLDLDFSSTDEALDEERLRTLMDQSLAQTERVLGVALRVQRIDRQPPGPNRTFVTYEVKVGYALPDDRRNQERMARGEPSKSIVQLDISLNEPICDDRPINIQAANPLRVSTIEDIIAEKLRSLLQQPIRNRNRRQDVLDIAVLLLRHVSIDRARIAEYLRRKAAARSVPVSREAFRNPEVESRARVDYEALKGTTRDTFIPFDEAFSELLGFIAQLDIPEE
ncbi:nucleotidyl transferase AbiEii/AbiGii toxin family protein [Archangium lansingense]|uniref:Nucleotidyl transferase AbiEii/AbiGii toxin family protein n=1 Tax=Archangium lansingense TaxID=2995310 RepID=A0ABT4APB6_9BACT|nr:nucleotidyl transferase AbiEii/AbiGii toxin family protein [Archangium lansinium]MCY1083552.1 nucleotidyl transferase AbiEii/AbiGii toxin family protein [Archangium lansinium]